MVQATENVPARHDSREAPVDQEIRQRLDACPYTFYYCKVTWRFERGVLTISGCVPTFTLRQNLLSLLEDVTHVRRVLDEVDVVNSNGVSSVRSR